MKKKWIKALLGSGYVVGISFLLLLQIMRLEKVEQRVIGGVEILLLVIPVLLLTITYLYYQGKKSVSRDGVLEKREVSIEEVHAQFLSNSKRYTLTERELEIAWLLFRGYTNRQIADELVIAESTVKKHTSHIYEKMQVSGKKELKERMKEKEAKIIK